LLNNDVDPDCAACTVEAVDALALRRGASDRAAVRRFAVLDHERPDVDFKLGGIDSD
jgi:hypothetical protein